MEPPRPAAAAAAPGAGPPSALTQALSRVLRQLSGRDSRRSRAQSAALGELGELLDAPGWGGLLGGGGPASPAVAELLGRVARALERYAAPAEERERERPGGRPRRVSARAARVGALFAKQLGKMGAAADPSAGLRQVAAPVYVFAVAHRLEQPWTDRGSREAAAEALAALLGACGCASAAAFLRGDERDAKGSFPAVMALLQPDLHKESWKNNPATKHVFSWTLQQVTRPWLSQYLEIVLPPSLLISDDYQTENKILGVHCLHHIILNVPAADLLQYNRAQVLYHALFNHLYTPECQLIQAVLLCLLDLFPILEKDLHWKGGISRSSTHCEEVLELVLTHMEPEHRLLLRRTYARNLPAFVKRLGILTVRHLKRLERVIIGYLEIYDGPEEEARLKILETLKLLMQYTWPRVSCRLVILLKALLKLICDVARDSSLTPEHVKSSLLEEATDCLILLDHCCQGQVKDLLARIPQSCGDSKVVKCINRVQQASEGKPYVGT